MPQRFLSAARAGHGLSVQSWALIERDIEVGTLQVIDPEPEGDLAYYLLIASGRAEAALLAEWLRDQIVDNEKTG